MIRRLAVLAALLAACGDGKIDPAGGEVTLVLTTAPPETGGLLLRITGPVLEATPLGGQRVALAPLASGNGVRLVITGPLGAGDLVRLLIPDLSHLPDYTVVVEQAAADGSFALLDPVTVGVQLTR